MKRRDFLRSSGAALGALGLNALWAPRLLRAAESQDRYYVFCYFEGGWDHLLGLDPRDPAVFTDAMAVETGIQPAYNRLPAQVPHERLDAGPFVVGPCAHSLARIADEVALVRGINMATLTHEVGRRYFITGRAPAGLRARGSSVAAVATAQLGGDRPVPYLSCRVETYAESLPSYASAMQVSNVEHVRYILQQNLGIPTPIRSNVLDAVHAYHQRQVDCGVEGAISGSAAAGQYRENYERARALVASGLHTEFEFDKAQHQGLRDRYGFGAGQTDSPGGRAALAAQALRTGLSRVVSVTLADGLDTHGQEWANDHSTRLLAGFEAFTNLIEDLRDSPAPQGGSMLDHTTVLAFSEFGRTARLNERNGRDHNLTNCALVVGAGIQGGQVLGSTSDNGMGPNLMDLASGQTSEAGASLKPEHVLTSVLHASGLDASDLRSEPIPALLS